MSKSTQWWIAGYCATDFIAARNQATANAKYAESSGEDDAARALWRFAAFMDDGGPLGAPAAFLVWLLAQGAEV